MTKEEEKKHKELNQNVKPITEEATEGLELFTEGSNGPLLDSSRKLDNTRR